MKMGYVDGLDDMNQTDKDKIMNNDLNIVRSMFLNVSKMVCEVSPVDFDVI